MARGTIAKENVIKRIQAAFGENFIGEQDKKLYVWANDGGEQVQIAISLTCPKTQIDIGDNAGGDWDFEDAVPGSETAEVGQPKFKPAEISQEENETLEALMKKFGL